MLYMLCGEQETRHDSSMIVLFTGLVYCIYTLYLKRLNIAKPQVTS